VLSSLISESPGVSETSARASPLAVILQSVDSVSGGKLFIIVLVKQLQYFNRLDRSGASPDIARNTVRH
jgi:hypothetical protein